MFNAVHARGEQGWKSSHLEPLFFGNATHEGIAKGE
jgi:hypothetical protein